MIGLIPFIAPIYAAVIAVALYFVVRVFVGRRKKSIKKSIGEGICARCGESMVRGKCPRCEKKT